MGLVFQVAVSCAPSGGVAAVTGNFSADTTYHYELSAQGGAALLDGSFSADLPPTLPGLANGVYTLALVDEQDSAVFGQRAFIVDCALQCDLVLSQFDVTAPTAAGGSGKLVFAVTSSAPGVVSVTIFLGRQYVNGLLPDGTGQAQTVDSGLPPGDYTLEAVDGNGCKVVRAFTVPPFPTKVVRGCTDPSATNYDPAATQDDGSCAYAPVVRHPHFEVPALQSLRFVKPGATDRPAFDNTLLADEKPLDFTVDTYCQKVEQGDTLVLQLQSNYQGAPLVQVVSAAGAVALSVPAVRVQQGAGQTQAFPIYAKPDAASGRVRLYFNDDSLPLPFVPGQRVTLSGTGTSLDGTYPLHDVLEDAAAAVPYLVVTAAYGSGSLRLDGTLTTTYELQKFDTYQAVLDFATVPRGCYQVKATATDTDFGTGLVVSEPVEVEATHPGTLLVAYRNFDNTWDLNYSAGLVSRLRVSGRFFHRLPAGEKQVLRNDDDTLQLLTASVYPKVQLEVLQVPGYLHETLFYAFSHDFVRVQGVRVVLEGEYTYTPVERYTLGKGAALLELQAGRGTGNRDDLGDTDVDTGGPYLLGTNILYLNAGN